MGVVWESGSILEDLPDLPNFSDFPERSFSLPHQKLMLSCVGEKIFQKFLQRSSCDSGQFDIPTKALLLVASGILVIPDLAD